MSKARETAEIILSEINKINEMKITSLLELVVKDEYRVQNYASEVLKIDTHIDLLRNCFN